MFRQVSKQKTEISTTFSPTCPFHYLQHNPTFPLAAKGGEEGGSPTRQARGEGESAEDASSEDRKGEHSEDPGPTEAQSPAALHTNGPPH